MYQIEIYRTDHSTPVDMAAVCESIADLMTDDQLNNHGDDVRESEKVYVEFGMVIEAVKRINALGYSTDEDNNEGEE